MYDHHSKAHHLRLNPPNLPLASEFLLSEKTFSLKSYDKNLLFHKSPRISEISFSNLKFHPWTSTIHITEARLVGRYLFVAV